MLAKELISDLIPSVSLSDTGAKVLQWMEFFRVSHLPIVQEKKFIGILSDEEIYDLNKPEEDLSQYNITHQTTFIYEDQHIYEVISLIGDEKISIAPVLSRDDIFLGVITINELSGYFSSLTASNMPGGIIVLEMRIQDYSLSEISQIVESNDAKILSLYLSQTEEPSMVNITVKVNQTELTAILKTFDRYSYNVKASYLKENIEEKMYEDRYQSLIKYLNI